MKKALIAFLAIGILSLGAISYAHMWGSGPGFQGQDSKFFDETVDLRKELQEKMFDYQEAYRAGDEKKLETLEKEITGLQEKLYDKAKDAGVYGGRGFGRGFGPGMMWGYGGQRGYGRGGGPGYGCPGPYGW